MFQAGTSYFNGFCRAKLLRVADPPSVEYKRVHDKILQARKSKRQSNRQFLPLPSTGTTVREAHVSYGETKSWRAWEAIGLG
jgi:hypothetical protein